MKTVNEPPTTMVIGYEGTAFVVAPAFMSVVVRLTHRFLEAADGFYVLVGAAEAGAHGVDRQV